MQFPKKATQSGLRIYDAAVRGHGGLKSARHEDVFRIRINFFHHDESRAHITRELHERVPGTLNVQEANNFMSVILKTEAKYQIQLPIRRNIMFN